jgi:hypothetical protein
MNSKILSTKDLLKMIEELKLQIKDLQHQIDVLLLVKGKK